MAGAAMWPPQAASGPKERKTSGMILLVFLAFYVFTLIDVSGLLTKLYKYESIPVQPIAFGVTAVAILPWCRGKKFPAYFFGAWMFFLLFTVGGMLGSNREFALTDYHLIQLVLKLGINLLGLPMLAFRTISRDRYPMLIKLSVLVVAIGGLFGVMQFISPTTFSAWLHEKGRGAGFWVSPNSCGEICVFTLFFSMLCPFRSKTLNWTVRLMILAGLISTMSRGGLAMLFAGAIMYAVAAKQWKTLARVGVGFLIVMVLGLALATFAKNAGMAASKRINRYTAVLTGDVSESGSDRMGLWMYGWNAVMEDPIRGRGHRSMEHIVPIGGGTGPHNYYLYVWGNSGLMGLFGYLGFLAALLRMGWRCKNTQNKASISAMTGMMAVTSLVSHSFINTVYFGTIFAMMALTAYYDQAPPAPRKQPVWPQQRPRVAR